ncbi:MAG: CRTAC1 family protein [Planctomycetota bacterium]|nr:CRTAC1 family protein [Planctomycetota bacterium]
MDTAHYGVGRSVDVVFTSRRLSWSASVLVFPILVSSTLADGLSPRASGRDTTGPNAQAWLVDITSDAGLQFRHRSGFDGSYHLAEIMGPGCGLFDYDGDGDLDILLIDGGEHPSRGRGTAAVTSRLWRQEQGGRFVDVTARARLSNHGYGMGCAVGDYNNDGRPDVYFTNYGPDRLFRNNGDGTFTDVTLAAGIRAVDWSVSATFVDYDCDGLLDLYVACYVAKSGEKLCSDAAGRPDYCGPASLPPVSDLLFRNTGGGVFRDVSREVGITDHPRRGLGVTAIDFDDDGRPEIYVANDGEANQLWSSRSDGTFVDRAMFLGLAFNGAGQPEASMGIAVGDANHDTRIDFFLTHLTGETNTLYVNRGRAGFDDATPVCGTAAGGLETTGFGVGLIDFAHDGCLDLIVANGAVARERAKPGCTLQAPFNGYAQPNTLLRGSGNRQFENPGRAAGDFGGPIEISRGLAFGDIDRDGDIDVLLAQCEGNVRLYRNDAPKRGHWLSVRARHAGSGRDAYGATVRLLLGGRSLTGVVNPAIGYASSSDPRVHFGLGDADRVERIEVACPCGGRQTFPGGGVDRFVELELTECRP